MLLAKREKGKNRWDREKKNSSSQKTELVNRTERKEVIFLQNLQPCCSHLNFYWLIIFKYCQIPKDSWWLKEKKDDYLMMYSTSKKPVNFNITIRIYIQHNLGNPTFQNNTTSSGRKFNIAELLLFLLISYGFSFRNNYGLLHSTEIRRDVHFSTHDTLVIPVSKIFFRTSSAILVPFFSWTNFETLSIFIPPGEW